MPGTRDHNPLVIEEFAGWWNRGDPESAPSNHFIQADNVQYFHSGVETRDGLTNYLLNALPVFKVKRMYNYVTQKGQTLIVLDDSGNIYHILGPSSTGATPILHVTGMEDFGFVAINGRAYITPFKTYTNPQGERYQLGLKNEFVYVYGGDPLVPARKAAGPPPTMNADSPMHAVEAASGAVDPGFHILAVVFETNTGYLTAPGPAGGYAGLVYNGTRKIDVVNIPADTSGYGVRRHIVSTKAIPAYNGDPNGYQFFFVPGAILPTPGSLSITLEYFDAELISDASHLIDNFSEIPAGVNLNTYHSRLVVVGEYGTDETLVGLPPGIEDNRSIARVSAPGEPESISKIDGLIIAPLDGKPLTNVQEFRDVMYLFKNTRTLAYSDNFDVPATWQEEVLDQGIGAPVHGVATVLDTGGVNIDFLLITDWSGLMLFNGTYAQPELSWKIEKFWRELDRNYFNIIQIVNDSLNKKIWISLPEPHKKELLHADYSDGMDAKNIMWAKWIFNTKTEAIALIETDRLILGTTGAQ